eukprot:3911874-Ditylum_brightwellii.AAC.1
MAECGNVCIGLYVEMGVQHEIFGVLCLILSAARCAQMPGVGADTILDLENSVIAQSKYNADSMPVSSA